MPPIRSQRSQELFDKEGRLLLATKAFKKKDDIASVRDAASRFYVPRTTLLRYIQDQEFCLDARASGHTDSIRG